jgi:hypothetical protein
VLQGSLRSDKDTADIEVEDGVKFLDCRFLKRLRDCGSGIIHQDVEAAKLTDGLLDGVLGGGGVRGVGLDRQALATRFLDAFNDSRSGVSGFSVSEGDRSAIRGKAFDDSGADSTCAACNEGNFTGEFLSDGRSAHIEVLLG